MGKDSKKLVEAYHQTMEREKARNEILFRKLNEYFAELCDLWDLEYMEFTEEGDRLLVQVGLVVGMVSNRHMVHGPKKDTFVN